jgi:hypothetical protein
MAREIDPSAWNIFQQQIEDGKYLCPKCGESMVVRSNPDNGHLFLSCSAFPDCKKSMQIPAVIYKHKDKMIPIGRDRKGRMTQSVKQFDMLRPILTQPDFLGGGKFFALEGTDSPILEAIDIHGSIDYVFLNENGLKTISSRIRTGQDMDSYGIRFSTVSGRSTEYSKLRSAIENHLLFPEIKIQAWIDDKGVSSLGMIRTVELLEAVDRGGISRDRNANVCEIFHQDGNFLAIKFVFLEVLKEIGRGCQSLKVWRRTEVGA